MLTENNQCLSLHSTVGCFLKQVLQSFLLFQLIVLMLESRFYLVLWHINHCRLFNAKSSLNIKCIWFGLVLWHVNPRRLFNAKCCLYIYFKYIWLVNILLITFLNEPQVVFFFFTLHIIKWFQIFLTWIILFTTESEMVTSIAI